MHRRFEEHEASVFPLMSSVGWDKEPNNAERQSSMYNKNHRE